MKRNLIGLAVAGVCLVAGPAAAQAKQAAPGATFNLQMDSYYNWSQPHTPPVSTPAKLAPGTYYVATVSGTFSYYGAINYFQPQRPWTTVCGTPGGSTQYSGSLGGDGPVGMDAEFVFSRPWTTKKCAAAHLPIHWGNFQSRYTGTTSWSHPNLLGPTPTVPASDHTYQYAVVGMGVNARFRLADVNTRDNYGLLDVKLRPATAADCASYAAFGFSSDALCVAALTPAG